jgi:acyl carrier protein
MPKTTPNDLEKQIREIICNMTGMEMEEVTPEGHFYRDLGIDSVKGIEMAVALQEKYNIRLDDSLLPKLTNVKLVAQEVNRLLSKKK